MLTTSYTRHELDSMSATDIRALSGKIRNQRRDNAISAVDLQRAGKSAQIVYILTGIAPAATPAPAPAATPAANGDAATLAAELASTIRGLIAESAPALDVDAVKALIADEINRVQVQTLKIVIPEQPEITVANPHRQLAKLVSRMNLRDKKGDRVHNWIAGMAGAGKTRGVIMASKALGLDFYQTSFGPDSHTGELVGMTDANGTYHSTAFRKAFEQGGVFLADEFDACPAEVAVALNAALDGADGYQFPDAYVARHPDFRCVVGANTFGTGPDAVYVGRTQLDGATTNRFIRWNWEVDESLEATLCGDAQWAAHVQKVRRAVGALRLKHIVGPRQSMQGAALLAAGESWDDVEAMTIYAGLDDSTVSRIRERIS